MFKLALVVLAGLLLIESSRSQQSEVGDDKRFVLETDLNTEVTNLKLAFAGLQDKITDMETKITQLTVENSRLSHESGAVFVRWGRNVCPSTSDIIYKGYTAGKHYSNTGSGTNTQCLPDDPTWSNYSDGNDASWSGYMYGFEMEADDSKHIFNGAVYNEDIPCAVCQSRRSTSMMIPGRNNCYGNWTMEYNGYLMASHYSHPAKSYICVDNTPEFVPGGVDGDDEGLLYLIEGRCGILQCPPYVEGRELACVVCTK